MTTWLDATIGIGLVLWLAYEASRRDTNSRISTHTVDASADALAVSATSNTNPITSGVSARDAPKNAQPTG